MSNNHVAMMVVYEIKYTTYSCSSQVVNCITSIFYRVVYVNKMSESIKFTSISFHAGLHSSQQLYIHKSIIHNSYAANKKRRLIICMCSCMLHGFRDIQLHEPMGYNTKLTLAGFNAGLVHMHVRWYRYYKVIQLAIAVLIQLVG